MTEPLKWVDELPANPQSPGSGAYSMRPTLTALRDNPGQWAEIARYDMHRRASAHSRGWALCHRHPDIEYALRDVDGQIALYLRAVKS